MTIFAKFSGVFHHVSNVYAKAAGVWKTVRAVYIKKNGIWKQVYGLHNFLFYALGLEQTVYPAANAGVWRDGIHGWIAGRSYTLSTYDKYGNVLTNQTFDVYGESQGSATGQIAGLTNALNALVAGTLFTLISFDEPQGGHTDSNLEAAVYRVGGTSSVYGQAMAYRGAYMLIGQVGISASYENYVGVDYTWPDGTTKGDPNAAIFVRGYIFENKWYLYV